MRSMLHKDLLILRRSRLLVGVLVVYPLVIALLLGLAISRAPQRPRVAIVDQTVPGETIAVGSQRVPVDHYLQQLFSQVERVPAATRAEAIQKVSSGDALAAVIVPANISAKLASDVEPAQLEVLYNGNALEQSLVRSKLDAALAQANLGFSEQIQKAAGTAIGSLLTGEGLGEIGAPEDLIGLDQISPALAAVIRRMPRGHDRHQLERIDTFASFASQNLGLARRVLSTIGQPIRVKSVPVQGRRTPLDTFAVVVAATVSLMFVCVLLAAGGIALEREESTLARLIRRPPAGEGAGRSLVSPGALLAEKALLAAACGFVLAFAMLAGVGAFVALDWGRIGLWALALAFAALAFAALGLAIGALARELRAASLLAFLLSLPLALLALVPAGAVSGALYAVIEAISFVFPFKAALQALDAAVNEASPALGLSLVHLALLALGFGALARVGLRLAD